LREHGLALKYRSKPTACRPRDRRARTQAGHGHATAVCRDCNAQGYDACSGRRRDPLRPREILTIATPGHTPERLLPVARSVFTADTLLIGGLAGARFPERECGGALAQHHGEALQLDEQILVYPATLQGRRVSSIGEEKRFKRTRRGQDARIPFHHEQSQPAMPAHIHEAVPANWRAGQPACGRDAPGNRSRGAKRVREQLAEVLGAPGVHSWTCAHPTSSTPLEFPVRSTFPRYARARGAAREHGRERSGLCGVPDRQRAASSPQRSAPAGFRRVARGRRHQRLDGGGPACGTRSGARLKTIILRTTTSDSPTMKKTVMMPGVAWRQPRREDPE